MCDVAYQVPRGDDPAYTDVLLEICRKENVDVLLEQIYRGFKIYNNENYHK